MLLAIDHRRRRDFQARQQPMGLSVLFFRRRELGVRLEQKKEEKKKDMAQRQFPSECGPVLVTTHLGQGHHSSRPGPSKRTFRVREDSRLSSPVVNVEPNRHP